MDEEDFEAAEAGTTSRVLEPSLLKYVVWCCSTNTLATDLPAFVMQTVTPPHGLDKVLRHQARQVL